jgi:16S rRNA G1207 methylase RsmC
MPHPTLECAGMSFELVRSGAPKQQSLQAWDAADSYLIEAFLEEYAEQNCLVLNDNFGTLGVFLYEHASAWISDSKCAHTALFENLAHNRLTSSAQICNTLEPWHTDSAIAVMRIPKTISFLKFLLHKLHQQNVKTVLLGGMMKHLPENILDLLLQYGPVQRLPFKKKATVYVLELQQASKTSYPKQNNFSGIQLISHANVFGRDKLDIGAEFFLQHIKKLPKKQQVADLCCGSGILGLKYLTHHPDVHMSFFDESHMAIASSEQSAKLNNQENVSFNWTDAMKGNDRSFDLILCNPPFHEQHTVGDHIAKRLFADAKQHLNQHGQLIVVGNRHLKYHVTLKRYFKNVEQIAANNKFVLLCAHT